MNTQRKHLRHVMLYCFKKDNNANDTKKICPVYGNGITTTTLQLIRKMKAAAPIQQRWIKVMYVENP